MIARLLTIVCTLTLAADAAAATRLTVLVRNQVNMVPLDGAVVCVGTGTNRAALGRRTSMNGTAIFETIPEGNWTITAWKANFGVIATSLAVNTSTAANTSRNLALSAGSASDPCVAAAMPPAPSSDVRVGGSTIMSTVDTPAITAFSINGGQETMEATSVVSLALQFSGMATEYRVSEVSGTFTDPAAVWRPLVQQPGGSIRLPTTNGSFATIANTKRIWLQLRHGTRISNIATDSISMARSYTASGLEAARLARQNGFQFGGQPSVCEVRGEGEIYFIEGTQAVPGTPCFFQLFWGRPLAPGWRFSAFTFAGECPQKAPPTTPTTQVTTFLQLTVPRGLSSTQGHFCEQQLRQVTLSGPYGARWQDAFAR